MTKLEDISVVFTHKEKFMKGIPSVRSSTKGFTLIEVIVTIAIAAILLSFSVGSLIKYQQYSAYRQNNEYAQTLFVAAQSALAHYKASGQLEDMKSGAKVGDTIAGSYYGRLYYLDISAGEADLENNPLYILLQDYVYDASILKKAAVRLEYDPVDGVVYSICYSNRAESFDESESDGNGSGMMGVALGNREESRRKKIMLGYYSSDLPVPSASTLDQLIIQEVSLKNEETLLLSWNMNQKYQTLANHFTYTVRIYDETNAIKMSFSLNSQGQGAFDNMLRPQVSSFRQLKTKVTFYGEDGRGEAEKECLLDAYVTGEMEICVVLDAVDMEAARILEEKGKQVSTQQTNSKDIELYQDTYSIKRFGLAPNKRIYAKVQASAAQYKASTWQPSNLEHPLLISEAADNDSLEIENARHLFNIRFMEAEANVYQYIQSGAVIWSGSEGILQDQCVYEKQKLVAADVNTAFPPIEVLKAGSIYRTQGVADRNQIKGLILTEKKDKKTGLFRINEGSIQDLDFVDVQVKGTDYTAAVCGLNQNELKNIRILSGQISGAKYVGAVAGSDRGDSTRRAPTDNYSYQSLSNAAQVSGRECVGGIVGYSASKAFVACENTGNVYTQETDGLYIGGIVGYNESATLQKCKSKMKNAIPEILSRDAFQGIYVGGLVGFQQSGKITECETTGGNVIGHSYVGGIVGFYQNEELGDDLVTQINRSNVIGWRYVGGITGANAKLINDQPDLDYNTQKKLINWVNQGFVNAGGDKPSDNPGGYAGGITGLNTGVVMNCTNDNDMTFVSSDAILAAIRSLGTQGDYVGGITGYNIGRITTTGNENIQVNSVVSGRNYVGGIVGYNAQIKTSNESGIVEKYTLSSGYIIGSDFVGGYAGLNTSENILAAGELSASPNWVEGEQYTGGVLGGNITTTSTDVSVNYNSNSQRGYIASTGNFTGGVIGFNKLVDCNWSDQVDEVVAQMTHATSADQTITYVAALQASAARMLIQNSQQPDHTAIGADSEVNEVRGNTYVGGIVGYNDIGTKLIISNVTNERPVIALGSIKSDAVTALGEEILFSYAGGIIGYVTENMIIDNCSNTAEAVITAVEATYQGGLAERNDGTIQSSSVNGIGKGNGYQGGLTGRNEATGTIVDCTVFGINIQGSVVGGITAENAGVIDNCDVSATIFGSSDTGQIVSVGGIAGNNTSTGKITNVTVGIQSTTKISTTVNGYTGGIIGWNNGLLSNVACSTGEYEVQVSGNQGSVGGLVGFLEKSGSVTWGENNVNWFITSTDSETDSTVAGMIGTSTSGKEIRSLINHGTVTTAGGSAAGIIGQIDQCDEVQLLEISECENYGDLIQGETGTVGGIVGVISKSNGVTVRIADCLNTGDTRSGDTTAGILALQEKDAKNSFIELVRCRNYGRNMFAGMVQSASNVTMIDCFNISNAVTYQMGNMGTSIRSYYFRPSAIEGDVGTAITSVSRGEMSFSAQAYNDIWIIGMGMNPFDDMVTPRVMKDAVDASIIAYYWAIK